MFWLRESCSKSQTCYSRGRQITEKFLSTLFLIYWYLYLPSCYFIYNALRDTVVEKEFDIVIPITSEYLLVQRFKKKEMSEKKKQLLAKTCNCCKASKFLWKNDLSRVYFDMKQTVRVFLSKVWKSEVY